jgi:uncharacterized membrane protein
VSLKAKCESAKFLLLLAAGLPAAALAAEPRYKAVALGAFDAGISASYGVGTHGAVAVLAEFDWTTWYAAVYRHGGPFGGPEELPDGDLSTALAVNGGGDAVGMSHDPGVYVDKAVFWPRSGGKIVIRTPKPDHGSKAVAINDAGLVVGQLATTDTKSRCFAWTQDQGYVDFGQPAGGRSCAPTGVNDHGQATGDAVVDGHDTAFVWKKGSFELLPLLPATDRCQGAAINDAGDVVGSCTSDALARSHPVLWRNGVAIDLYPFDDLQGGVALGIDDAGTIVGSLTTSQSERDAVVFDGQGGVTDLHDLVRDGQGLLLYAPGGISKNGTISAGGYKLVPLRR